MSRPIYASDPDGPPDSQFEPGEIAHLVTGNRGRMLDARRTPVTVRAVTPATGSFELELGAFEDAGARWELGLDEIDRFEFARGSARTDPAALETLQRAVARFDRELAVESEPQAQDRTEDRLARERARVRAWLGRRGRLPTLDLEGCIERRAGDPRLFALLERFLNERGLEEMDRRFGETFVSNPRSGELVKGHAIVLAELGLRHYRGKVVRHPDLFAGSWSKHRRAEHLLARMAFVRELWASFGVEAVTLYRGAAVDGTLRPRRPGSLASATFSRAVAEAHFEGAASTRAALLWRGRVSVDRLLMTFLETAAMNGRFNEAEAVLLDGPDVM